LGIAALSLYAFIFYLGRTVAYLAKRHSIAERMAMSEHASACRR
jgi:hypothetical protein